jgi:hypothetical protein
MLQAAQSANAHESEESGFAQELLTFTLVLRSMRSIFSKCRRFVAMTRSPR